MSLKHWALVGGAVACLSSASAFAAPWMEPGDARARFAVQKLADRGWFERPTTTWPIMWGDVKRLDHTELAADVSAVGAAASYLEFESQQQSGPGFRAEVSVSAQSEIPALTGFESNSFAEGSVSGTLQWQGESFAFGLSPAWAANPDDDQSLRLDGSYLAAVAGNWVLGMGSLDRWWGPGWSSSLILSNNARPIPSVWLTRNDRSAPDSDWLSWIGPWGFTVFAGQYESDRKVPDAKLLAMRFAFRPLDGLDIGLSRAIMFGGEGRPENLSTLWNSLIGRDNGQLEEDDPGNQLASVDARYGFAAGSSTVGLYGQMMGEDEAGAFPARKSWLFGVDWTSQWLEADQQWYLEYVNTFADDLLSDALPNISYEHSRYQTGFRYYGRNMATGLDGDAEAMSFGLYHFLDNGANLRAKLTFARLNQDGTSRTHIAGDDVFYTVPDGAQDVTVLDLGYGRELFNGWLDLGMQVSDDKINYLSGEKDAWSAAASWTYRF